MFFYNLEFSISSFDWLFSFSSMYWDMRIWFNLLIWRWNGDESREDFLWILSFFSERERDQVHPLWLIRSDRRLQTRRRPKSSHVQNLQKQEFENDVGCVFISPWWDKFIAHPTSSWDSLFNRVWTKQIGEDKTSTPPFVIISAQTHDYSHASDRIYCTFISWLI